MASVAPTAAMLDGSMNRRRRSVAFRRGRSVSRLDKLQDFMNRSRSAQLPIIRFAFTHHALRRVWWLVLIVQLMNAAQLLGFSYMYLAYLIWPTDSLLGSIASSLLTTSHQAFLDDFALWIGIAYAILAASFSVSTAIMVFATIWRGQTEFGVSRRRLSKPTRPSLFTSSVILACWRRLIKSRLTKDAHLRRLWVKLTHWDLRFQFWLAAFGVEGRHFERALLLREAIELLLQTTQAYQVSHRVSRPHANYAYTTLIALNALVHPITTRFLSTNKEKRRFVIIFVDFFLDFIWGCALPLWMYWPYFQVDRSVSLVEVYARDGIGSIENAQREVEQVLILSSGAFLASMFPFVSALVGLQDLKKLLVDSRLIDSFKAVAPRRKSATVPLEMNVILQEVGVPGPHGALVVRSARRLPRKTAILQWLLTFGGLATVVIAAIASAGLLHPTPHGVFKVWEEDCRYPLTPWLATAVACSVWRLDCTKMAITGTAQEMQRALHLMHPNSLVFLDIHNCTSLEVPANLDVFHSLRGLHTTNTTVQRWNTAATLSASTFPLLHFVGFRNSTFSETINGTFLGLDRSSALDIFHVADTNASTILQASPAIWTHVQNFECSACGLTEFPLPLFWNTGLRSLTIENAELRVFPPIPSSLKSSDRSIWPHMRSLNLRDNAALSTLPVDVWRVATTGSLQVLILEFTNISTIPTDALRQLPPRLTIFAHGTPLCDPMRAQGFKSAVVCAPST